MVWVPGKKRAISPLCVLKLVNVQSRGREKERAVSRGAVRVTRADIVAGRNTEIDWITK